MYHVLIYSFEGRYEGSPEYDFAAPIVGEVHKCILFVLQEAEACDFSRAKEEIRRFGFSVIANLRGKPILVESLNTDQGKKFVPYYEEAVAKSSSLTWYPNT
jgi:hypothetical protein